MIPSTPLAQQPEPVLVALAQAGDEAAFAALYARYARPLCHYLYGLTRDVAQAEDDTQETFAKAWRTLPRTRPDTAFGAWIYRIGTNLVRDRARHNSLVSLVRWEPANDLRTAGRLDQPASVLDLREAQEGVALALQGLPAHYRRVLVLIDLLELRYWEAGELLGGSSGAIKGLVYRAREAFRRRWLAQQSGRAYQAAPRQWRRSGRHGGCAVAPDVRREVVALKGTGLTQAAIARRLGIGRSTVAMWWKEAA